MSAQDGRKDVWSRYWAGGSLHSCAGSFDGNYAGEIRGFWQEAFAGLRPGQRMLDIATGNGPLPRLLLELRPEADLCCDAVDLAQVAPSWVAALPSGQARRLRFHPGVEAEDLPFADGSFDLVVSQYGIEYSRLAQSLPEARRVLAPGGRVRLLVHHAGSVPVTLAHEELRHIDWLQSPQGLLAAAVPMLEPMARAASEAGRLSLRDDASANAARLAFNRSQAELGNRAGPSACPDILHETRAWVAQALQAAQAGGAATGGDALAQIRQLLADSRLRLQELCDHALDDSAVQALCRQLEALGDTDCRPLKQGGRLMAWAIRAG